MSASPDLAPARFRVARLPRVGDFDFVDYDVRAEADELERLAREGLVYGHSVTASPAESGTPEEIALMERIFVKTRDVLGDFPDPRLIPDDVFVSHRPTRDQGVLVVPRPPMTEVMATRPAPPRFGYVTVRATSEQSPLWEERMMAKLWPLIVEAQARGDMETAAVLGARLYDYARRIGAA